MKTQYTEYLKEILNSYSNGGDKYGRILFMRHYSSFGVNHNLLKKIVKSSEIQCHFVYHEFRDNVIQSPYEPFLDIIRNIYVSRPEEELEKMLSAVKVYSLHRPLIRSYVYDGFCKRDELLLISEISYERERLLQSLVDMVNYIGDTMPLIIVLHNLHFAQKSTIDVLMRFIKGRKNHNMSILAGYNEMYSMDGHVQQVWDGFIKCIESEDIVAEGDIDERMQHSEMPENVINDINGIRGCLIRIHNLNSMMALEDALYYIEKIHHRFLVEQFEISETNTRDILALYAYIAICSENMKAAFLMCKKLSDMEHYEEQLDSQYIYNYLVALLKGNDRKREQAYSYIDACKEVAVKLKDSDKLFQAELLRCVVWHGGWKDVFIWDEKLEVDLGFLEEAERREQYNHLAYIYFFGFIGEVDSDIEENSAYIGCEKSSYFRKGMELAEKVGNSRCLLRAWQKQIIFASSNGRHDEVEYYYAKCLRISKEQHNKEKEADLYNGLGYTYIITEKYELADKYFKKAIKILIEKKDPEFIMETIYNMALNALSVENYDVVIQYISAALKMLKQLRLERVRVCNRSKLYGLMIVSYIKTGRIYDAKLYIDRMQRVLRHLLNEEIEPDYRYWEDDIFIYYMIMGMLNREEGNYKPASESFHKALELWKIFDSKQEYIFIQFIIEAVALYDKMGDKANRELFLNIGIEFCRTNQYSYQRSRLEKLKDGIYVTWENPQKTDMRLPANVMHDILELTSKRGMEIEIEEKGRALLFFEAWVDLINRENISPEEMIQNAMTMLQNTYNPDSILWIKAGEQPVIKYSDAHSSITIEEAKYIVEYFNHYKQKIVVTRSEKNFDANYELIKIFGENKISSFIGIPIISKEQITNILIVMQIKHMNFIYNPNQLTEEDADIFRTTFRQLIDAGNREKFRMKLEQSSITDTLTGLLNRYGMKQFMEGQFEENKNKNVVFTVLYMDLDNFKYCNDAFGHDVGDAVLVGFSKMLNKIIGNTGSIIRYGGDEFVVLLPEHEVDDGIQIAENIFDTLEENKGFREEIETALNKKVMIAKSSRLSCSIGISTGKCKDTSDILKILKKADVALYEVKRTTKHDYNVNI